MTKHCKLLLGLFSKSTTPLNSCNLNKGLVDFARRRRYAFDYNAYAIIRPSFKDWSSWWERWNKFCVWNNWCRRRRARDTSDSVVIVDTAVIIGQIVT